MKGLFSQAGSHICRARGLFVDDGKTLIHQPCPSVFVSFRRSHFLLTCASQGGDRTEGSIISSIISQLKFVSPCSQSTYIIATSLQNRHGPLRSPFLDFRSRSSQYSQTHGLGRTRYIWVRASRCPHILPPSSLTSVSLPS